MNPRPPGYEPDELPDCSTPRSCTYSTNAMGASQRRPQKRPASNPHAPRSGPSPQQFVSKGFGVRRCCPSGKRHGAHAGKRRLARSVRLSMGFGEMLVRQPKHFDDRPDRGCTRWRLRNEGLPVPHRVSCRTCWSDPLALSVGGQVSSGPRRHPQHHDGPQPHRCQPPLDALL